MIEHVFRQSDLNTFLTKCPEQLRLSRLGELPQRWTDGNLIGTVVHEVIEEVLTDHITLPMARDLLLYSLDKHCDEHEVTWLNRTRRGTEAFGLQAVTAWYGQVLPTLDPEPVIEETCRRLLYEDDVRRIVLSGTIDYRALMALKDWKTSGSKYEKWEYERYALQPTVYSWLAFGDDMASTSIEFEYVVMLPGGKIQRFTVMRDMSHIEWLRKQCLSLVELIEADLDQWPLNDQGWHCSRDWCPVYYGCKGQHVDVGRKK